MSKAVLYAANTAVQTVGVGEIIGLGSIQRRFGCAVNLLGGAVVINDLGFYDVDVSVTAEPTAAGTFTVQLLNNGVAVPGATASATAATDGSPVNISLTSIVRIICGASRSLTLELVEGAANITNVALTVEKL